MFTHNLSVTKNQFGDSRSLLEENLFPIEIEIVKALYNVTLAGYDPSRDKKNGIVINSGRKDLRKNYQSLLVKKVY